MTRGRGNHPGHAGLEPLGGNAGMRAFDAQPGWMKRLLWDSPLNLTLDEIARDSEREEATAELLRLEQEAAAERYGADHPAALQPRDPASPPPAKRSPAKRRRTR